VTGSPERFKELDRVYLTSPAGKEIVCRITSVRYSGTAPLILFKDYDTPEKAKAISGWLIQVPKEEAVPLPEGSFYWYELIGMEVFSEAGEKRGTITHFAEDKHKTAHDSPYGGGAGMVLKPEPIFKAIEAVTAEYPGERLLTILLSPQGRLFDQRQGGAGLCEKGGG